MIYIGTVALFLLLAIAVTLGLIGVEIEGIREALERRRERNEK